MSSIIPDKISIFYIKVYKSNHSSSEEYLENPVKPANIKVQLNQNSAFNLEEKNIRIRLEIILSGVDEQDKEIGLSGEYGIEFQLHIENLEDYITKEGEEIRIDNQLGVTVLSIVYSTARGILIERTQLTLLNGVILPILDPKDLIR